MKKLSVFIISCLVIFNVKAQTSPPSAEQVMTEAKAIALKEGKKVLILFSASWCVWCHRMDTSLNDPACKKFFDDNFVVRHLIVDESKEKKYLENAGAVEMKAKYYGAGQGIPYWLIFDSKGNLMADSKSRKEGEGPEQGENTGCPATEAEVNYFIEVLKKQTSLDSGQLEIIRKRFRKNES